MWSNGLSRAEPPRLASLSAGDAIAAQLFADEKIQAVR